MLFSRSAAALHLPSVRALTTVLLTIGGLYACERDRVVVQAERTLTSAASSDSTTSCGNGALDFGEICDDGNVQSGDGCDATCVPDGDCGDAIVGVGEDCEPPNSGSCNSQCRRLTLGCGNGILEEIEECEDGNALGGDGCSAECLREACGNGRIDLGEDCEPPGAAQCSAVCKRIPTPVCGNGLQESGEECEDGNASSGDGCGQFCLLEFCGNGRVDPPEGCEPPGTDTCNARCQPIPAASRRGVCGNSVQETGEECDDGNTFEADGCSGGCEREVCGNGRLDPGEYCEPPNTAVCNARCIPQLERCGDRKISAGEACDDGNTTDGDGCSARCALEACGNGTLDVGEDCEPPGTKICDASCKRISRFCGNRTVEAPEECDDGNVLPGDGCDLRCQLEFCGNGRIDFGEQCELPGTEVCDTACRRVGTCGNGTVDVGESCDPPNGVDCTVSCQLSGAPPPSAPGAVSCGNGALDTGEECDDTNQLPADGCSPTCTKEVCGNSRTDAGEECDDGNVLAGDGCSDICRSEVCGNGRIDSAVECEPPGSAGCSATCRVIKGGCGNAQLEAPEQCDDGNTVASDGCSATCQPEPAPAAPEAAAPQQVLPVATPRMEGEAPPLEEPLLTAPQAPESPVPALPSGVE
ncbi:MAG: hypothetical protein RL685_393 [Pseudomonadota bacterium]|jgi:cysteine-rich repeat protein